MAGQCLLRGIPERSLFLVRGIIPANAILLVLSIIHNPNPIGCICEEMSHPYMYYSRRYLGETNSNISWIPLIVFIIAHLTKR
ncbi:hypothetical protein F5Y03DRAFT_204088 [Xylaria venustula]|nr:hypothetical protein F5Y03DRAFT_204088 [Xylaria venustula]